MAQNPWLVWDSPIWHNTTICFFDHSLGRTKLPYLSTWCTGTLFLSHSKLNFSSWKEKGKLTSPSFCDILHCWRKLKLDMLKSSLRHTATQGTGLTEFNNGLVWISEHFPWPPSHLHIPFPLPLVTFDSNFLMNAGNIHFGSNINNTFLFWTYAIWNW